MKNKTKMYRQGDVLLVSVSELPTGLQKRSSGVLAYGEVTGHSHAVADAAKAEVYETDAGLFLQVSANEGVSIVHQEHGEVVIPKGDYSVVIQREYSPEEIRNVVD